MAISDRMMKGCTLSQWRGSPLRCRWCNEKLTGRQKRWCSRKCGDAAFNNHWFSSARKSLIYAAHVRRMKFCVKCSSTRALEVNHITPCLGAHGTASCAHHIDGLEILCHDCHVKVTRIQRESGQLSKKRNVQ